MLAEVPLQTAYDKIAWLQFVGQVDAGSTTKTVAII